MDISLLHAGLAGGAALAVVPLVLHLLMRQTPKHIIFPALRLIRERQKQAKKRLRVKNWLLLLARMALFALMALALARPTLHTLTPLGDQEVDTAIALVIDTSLSMEYAERGNDRLKEAKIRSAEILKKATDRSEVFVIDSAEPSRDAPVSPALATKRVEALELRDANRPLNAAVLQAYAAVGGSGLARREVYVLTDLARSSWDLGSGSIADAIRKANTPKPTIATYVLRLTPKEVKDVAVVTAEPASYVATQGEPLEVKAKVRSWGPKTSRVAEFFVDKVPRDTKKPIDLPENGEVEVSFRAPNNLPPGLHQGEVRVGGLTDNMTWDDVRYFSFTVQPARRVLLISEASIDAFFTNKALAPDSLPDGTPQLARVDRMTVEEFARTGRTRLNDYAAVFVLNVPRLVPADWSALNQYVLQGGGLVVALGERVVADSYNEGAASQLLPARLDQKKLAAPNTFFARPDQNHPIFNAFARELDAKLSRIPVYRAWAVTPQAGRTLLWLSDGSPALLERTFQGARTGHVLLWVTPFRVDPVATIAWNELPREWPFLEILLQSIAYLSGSGGDVLNVEAGQDAFLPIDPSRRSANYTVQGPDPKSTFPLPAPTTSDKLVVPIPQKIGHWRVEGKAPDGSPVVMGFSVNAQEGEATVVPLEKKELVALFGSEENVQLAEDAKGLDRIVTGVRIGFEIFPWLMVLILLLVTFENLLANKFHRERAAA